MSLFHVTINSTSNHWINFEEIKYCHLDTRISWTYKQHSLESKVTSKEWMQSIGVDLLNPT